MTIAAMRSILVLTAFAGSAGADEIAAVDATVDATVDEIAAHTLERLQVPGMSVAVSKNHELVFARGYGVASLELDVPVTTNTVFPIASVTKAFTSTLVMDAIHQGKLSLETPIGNVLGDLPEAWRALTISQLLSHTSGLPDLIVDPLEGTWRGHSLEDALAEAGDLGMSAAPGEVWSYNQTNYVLLGMALERLNDEEALVDLVTERIFEELGLTSASFGDATVVVPRRTSWYSRIERVHGAMRLAKSPRPLWVTYPAYTRPCAGINLTASELARFVDAIAEGTLLAPEARDAMWQPATLADGSICELGDGLKMGLGWMVEDVGGRRCVGGTGGASVAFRHYVKEALTVVVLTNCQGVDPDSLVHEVATPFLR